MEEESGAELAPLLRARTAALHREAERTGIVGELLRGRGSPAAYALYLRNLLPAYRALEAALERRRGAGGPGLLAQPALYRAAALEADLASLAGPSWAQRLPLLEAGRRYARRVAAAGRGEGAGLVAHAYVRHLADLSGGPILGRLLARSLGLGPQALGACAFPAIPDLARFKAGYREALEQAAAGLASAEAIAEEAALAFRLNIAVSCAVLAAADRSR